MCWALVFHDGEWSGAGVGFKFADPHSPPLGDHAPSFAMTMDGEHPILAWGAGAGLVSVEHDGTSFPAPLVVVDGAHVDQVALAAGRWRAHIGWTYFTLDFGGIIEYDAADLPLAPPVRVRSQ